MSNIFRGLFDTDMTSVISVTDFFLCIGCSLLIGLILAFSFMYRSHYTKSFVVTLALLPAVVCVVIMMVNGNVGAGVAVAGAFSLVRFRSAPGTAKEITMLFLAMGAGLIAGMGYLSFALLFTIIMCLLNIVYKSLFPSKRQPLQSCKEEVRLNEKNHIQIGALLLMSLLLSACGQDSVSTDSEPESSNNSESVDISSTGAVENNSEMFSDRDFEVGYAESESAGKINITESYEGLEGLSIEIQGGDIVLTASDDGLNAAGGTDQSGFGGRRGNEMFGGAGSGSSSGSIVISGGTINVTAYGDGIDSNGTLEITDGYITVCGPMQGDTATLDYDVSAVIAGGTFIGPGASGMAQTFSDAKQGIIAVGVGNQSAGTQIKLTDSKGNTVLTHTPELSFAVVIISSPDIISGDTYTMTVGSISGEITVN